MSRGNSSRNLDTRGRRTRSRVDREKFGNWDGNEESIPGDVTNRGEPDMRDLDNKRKFKPENYRKNDAPSDIAICDAIGEITISFRDINIMDSLPDEDDRSLPEILLDICDLKREILDAEEAIINEMMRREPARREPRARTRNSDDDNFEPETPRQPRDRGRDRD